jgi:cathepsin B
MRATVILLLISIALSKTYLEEIVEEVRSKPRLWVAEDPNESIFRHYTKRDMQNLLTAIMDPIYTPPMKQNLRDDSYFDARIQWPNCVHPIRDQQSCGSCWAFSSSEGFSDRVCIATNGAINEVYSPQELVSCDTDCYGCDGGWSTKGYEYISKFGIYTDECYPYKSGSGQSLTCNKAITCATPKRWANPASVVQFANGDVASIKASLKKDGPLSCSFSVYRDFMSYKGGIYVKTSNEYLGGHAVKPVGYGYDSASGKNYWIVANSWNAGWGENGFFRIAEGECAFESRCSKGEYMPK